MIVRILRQSLFNSCVADRLKITTEQAPLTPYQSERASSRHFLRGDPQVYLSPWYSLKLPQRIVGAYYDSAAEAEKQGLRWMSRKNLFYPDDCRWANTQRMGQAPATNTHCPLGGCCSEQRGTSLDGLTR